MGPGSPVGTPKAILIALMMLFAMEVSPDGITLVLGQRMDVRVHRTGIQRWTDRYVRLVEWYADGLRPSTGSIWSCNERPARVKRADHQFTVIDAAGRFVLS